MLSRRAFAKLIAAFPLTCMPKSSPAAAKTGSFYYRGPISDHFDGQRFFNPGGERARGFSDFLRWKLASRAEPWPASYPSSFQDVPPQRVASHELRISFVGHATFLIQMAGINILTDPVWSERASPVQFAGPRRYNDPGIVFSDLPRIDVVLVSHNHYDHLDVFTLDRLWERDKPRILAPLGNDTIIRTHNPRIDVTPVDWGDEVQLASGIKVVTEPAHHWSARATNDRNHALWASFAIKSRSHRVYFAGDTGFGGGRHFRAIAARHGRMHVALLPIGAYEPRWFMAPHHMNPDDAVRAFQILRADHALGFHWGTFRLTDEGVDRPVRDLSVALQKNDISSRRFLAVRPGEHWSS